MSAVLLALAVVCAAVAALLGFGVLDGSHTLGWLALAVAFVAASGLTGYLPRRP